MNADQIISLLNKLESSLDDLSPAMRGVKENLEQLVRTTFRLSIDPYGNRWTPLKASTLLQRRRKGIQGSSPLFATSELFDSIKGQASANGASVFVGTENRPAGVHQEGSTSAGRGRNTTIPARPFLPIKDGEADVPESWLVEINRPIIDQLQKIANAA